MKNRKRILAAVLSVIMTITMLPSAAFATEVGENADGPAAEAVSVPGEEQNVESVMETVSEGPADEQQEEKSSETVQPEGNADQEEENSDTVQGEENPDREEETTDAEKEEIPEEAEEVLYPAQDFEEKTANVTVRIKAPQGALPSGTKLVVTEVEKDEVADLVGEVTENAADFIAVDITFYLGDDIVEPREAVEVEFALEKDVLPEVDAYDVIHVAVDEEKGTETPEIIEEEKIIEEITAEGGIISQKDFSVFIIAAANQTSANDQTTDEPITLAVETWNFYIDAEDDEPAYTQAVKAGETLEEPPRPVPDEDGMVFAGWFDGDEEVVFGVKESVTSRVEHQVYARFEEAVYVVFVDYDGTTIIDTKKAAVGDEVDVTDVSADSRSADQIFAGWALSEDAEESVGDSITVDADTTLYPYYVAGHTLTFDANDDDGAGSPASHTPTQYLLPGDTTFQPEDPERTGFTFGGWYTDENYTDVYEFERELSTNETAIAKWDGGDTTYTIIIWQQKVTDDRYAADADKTYDFFEASEPITAASGDVVNAGSAYTGRAFDGFVYNSVNSDHDVVVKADGSTVVNVRYDRQLITYKFNGGIYRRAEEGETPQYYYYSDPYSTGYYYGPWGPEPHEPNIGTGVLSGYEGCDYWYRWNFLLGRWEYVDPVALSYGYYYHYENRSGYYRGGQGPTPNATLTHVFVQSGEMQGLFGQPFEKYGYRWPAGEWRYQNVNNGTTGLVYLGEFILLAGSPTPLNVTFNTSTNTRTYTIYYYLQDVDGEYKEVSNLGYGYTNASQQVEFEVLEKYDGYHAESYFLGEYESGGEENPDDPNSQGVPGATDRTECKEHDVIKFKPAEKKYLHLFYARNSYDVEFKYTDGTEASQKKTYVYGADISELADLEADYPNASEAGNYEFTGWYTDQGLYNKVDFNGMTMPAEHMLVYAGFKRITHTVTLDANGGTFADGSTDSRTIEVTHLEPIPADELGAGSVSRQDYELIGWTKGTANGPAWDPDDIIEEDITLVAKWRTTKSLKLTYHEVLDGDNTFGDSRLYRDEAFARITDQAPEVSEDEYGNDIYFRGWSEDQDGTGTVYRAGMLYKIAAAKADDEGEIHLYAVYSHFKSETTTILFYPNLEDAVLEYDSQRATGIAEDQYITREEFDVNTEIDLGEIVGSHRTYKLVGWARTPDGEKVFDADAHVSADNIGLGDDGSNVLYAKWEIGTFTVHHSSREGKEGVECCQTITMPTGEDKTFNIVDVVDDDHLYGGYYHYENETKGEAYEASGFEMEPVQDTVYYLKEVEETYLVPMVYIVWSKYQDFRLRSLHVLTDVDDMSYKTYGIRITGEYSEYINFGRHFYSALSVTNVNESGEQKTTPYPIQGIFGVAGRLGVGDASKYVLSEEYKNKELVLTAYFVTPDNVQVNGVVQKTINLGDLSNRGWAAPGITQVKDSVDSVPDVCDFTFGPGQIIDDDEYVLDPGSDVISYTITKYDDGSKEHQAVEPGDNRGNIDFAGKEGYVFAGWYKDAAFTEAADFSNVNSDMTVYARYIKDTNVKLSFTRKAAQNGTVTLKATLKITGMPEAEDAAVDCIFNDSVYAVDFTDVKTSTSGNLKVNTYSGTVEIAGLVSKSEFKAAISYVTSDGTKVSMNEKTCKYSSGIVTVK